MGIREAKRPFSRWRFSPQGNQIAISCENCVVELLGCTTWKLVWAGVRTLGQALDLDFSPEGRRIVAATDHDEAIILDRRTGALLLTLVG